MSTIPSKQAYDSESDGIDLSTIFNQLSKNRWVCLAITLIIFAAGVFYASKQIPQYQSNLLLQIEVSQVGALAQQFMLRSPTGDVTITEIALMQSRYVLEPVIKSLGLDISATPKIGSIWSWITWPRKKTVHVKLFEVPRNQIDQQFNLVVDKPAHVTVYNSAGNLILQGAAGSLITSADKTIRLEIGNIKAPVGTQFTLVKHADFLIAKSLARQLKIEVIGASTHQNTGVLELSMTGDDPRKIMGILNAIAKMTQVKDSQKKSKQAGQTLAFLYHQLPITKGLLEKAETALNQYRAQTGKIDIKQRIQFFLNQLADLDKQLGVLRITKIDMLQRYTVAHPEIIALDTQSTALKAQRISLEKKLKTLPASDQIAVNLMRDVTVKKTLYMLLLSKLQDLEVVKAGSVSSVHILSHATMPNAPLPSKSAVIYLSSILCGFMLSIMIVVARKFISPRIDDPHWGEQHFNLANLAIIPYCKEQTQSTLRFNNGELKDMPLLAHASPRNLSIESLRSLRTSLQVTLACSSNNIIAILGMSFGIGKSFVSANLAYLLAAGGKRVLLIDGDLRRGTLHKYMNVSPMLGLAEVLKKTATVESALVKTLHKNLDFIPRGAYPTDPSELLMSDHFKALMTRLAQAYDVVVIDTAPVLMVTDAVLIGSIAAANYLVMGAGAHKPAEIEITIKRLAGSGVQLQGSIFNFHLQETFTRSYGKYGKYGKYSYYNTYYDDVPVKG